MSSWPDMNSSGGGSLKAKYLLYGDDSDGAALLEIVTGLERSRDYSYNVTSSADCPEVATISGCLWLLRAAWIRLMLVLSLVTGTRSFILRVDRGFVRVMKYCFDGLAFHLKKWEPYI